MAGGGTGVVAHRLPREQEGQEARSAGAGEGATGGASAPGGLTRVPTSMSTLSSSSGREEEEEGESPDDEGTEAMVVSTTEDETSRGALLSSAASSLRSLQNHHDGNGGAASSGDDNEASGAEATMPAGGGADRRRPRPVKVGGSSQGPIPDVRDRTDSFLSSSDDDDGDYDSEERDDEDGDKDGVDDVDIGLVRDGSKDGSERLPPMGFHGRSLSGGGGAGRLHHHHHRRRRSQRSGSIESGATGATGATNCLSLSYSASVASPEQTPTSASAEAGGTARNRIRTDTGTSKTTAFTAVSQVTQSTGGTGGSGGTGGGISQVTQSTGGSSRSSTTSDAYSLAFSHSTGSFTPISQTGGGGTTTGAMGTVSETSDGAGGYGKPERGSVTPVDDGHRSEKKKTVERDERGNSSTFHRHRSADNSGHRDFDERNRGTTSRSPPGQKSSGDEAAASSRHKDLPRRIEDKQGADGTTPPPARRQFVTDNDGRSPNTTSSSGSPSPVKLGSSPRGGDGRISPQWGKYMGMPRPVSPAAVAYQQQQQQQMQQQAPQQPAMTTIDGVGGGPTGAAANAMLSPVGGGGGQQLRSRIDSTGEGSIRSVVTSDSGRDRVTSEDLRNLPPVHNFFGSVLGNASADANQMARASPRYYDSDGSGNGSVVYSSGGNGGAGSGGGSRHGGMGGGGRGLHERFSSVDSSGSFVRRPSPRVSAAAGGGHHHRVPSGGGGNGAYGAPMPPPVPAPMTAAPPGQPYPSTPYARRKGGGGPQQTPGSMMEATPHASNTCTPSTRMLPYNVRRQLMEQRRQREDEEARMLQAQRDSRTRGGGGRQAHRGGGGGGGKQHRVKRPAKLSVEGGQPGRHQPPPALTPKGGPGKGQMRGASWKKGQQTPLPPSGYGSGNRTRLSSADSFDSSPESKEQLLPHIHPRHPAEPQPQQVHNSHPRSLPFGQQNNAPAIERAPSHVRAGSTGSVSSLGSNLCGPGSISGPPTRSLTDRLGGEIAGYLRESSSSQGQARQLQPQQKQQQLPPMSQQHQGRRGFFSNFISPKAGGASRRVDAAADNGHHQRNLSIEDQKQEFHERNQAFLNNAERAKARMNNTLRDLSPQRRTYIRSNSPRPPSTRGSHRPGLASIDNDNWEDEMPDESPRRGKQYRHENSRPNQYYARSKHDKKNGSLQRQRGDHSIGYGTRNLVVGNANDGSSHDRVGSRSSKSSGRTSRSRSSKSNGDREGRGRWNGRGREGYNRRESSSSESSDSITFSSDETSDSDFDASSFLDSFNSTDRNPAATERTSLLPPSGISTHESHSGRSRPRSTPERDLSRKRRKRSGNRDLPSDRQDRRGGGNRRNKNRHGREYRYQSGRRERRDGYYQDQYECRDYGSGGDSTESSTSSHDHDRWEKKKARMLEKERARFMLKWREEARAELEAMRAEEEASKWHNKVWRWGEGSASKIAGGIGKFFANAEAVICNMPSTIGAVALAIVTLGVVWFKFAEENLDSCQPVHFHSSQCSFPEFPGCFYCDTSASMYKVAVNFHYVCSTIAGILVIVFFAKVILAWRVVIDELSSPTTSSPAGLICMTMVCVFAGRGWIGQALVTSAAAMHFCLVIWFLYMALAYRILPDPSWYPNTVGVGLSAVKTWLYYSNAGHLLMAVSLCLNIFFFPISVFRVSVNTKISAPVCWIQMSAPAVALYSLTIMAQPPFEEEHPDVTTFQRVHRMVYLPCMHFMFVISVIGALSSAQSLFSRWESFSKKEFSPAHAAFCFPTLAHANAIQAYRGAVDSFSNITPGSPFKILIFSYWLFVLLGGTIATFIITAKFFYNIPSWTLVDVEEEEEPPAPSETLMVTAEGIFAGETMRQNFVSPAVLQANETGVLLALPRGHPGARYRRTRKVTALGFEPIMSLLELDVEREALLEMVAKNPPRRRRNTLSVPGIDFKYGYGDFGTGNTGIFDLESGGESGTERQRAQTLEGGYENRRTNTGFF